MADDGALMSPFLGAADLLSSTAAVRRCIALLFYYTEVHGLSVCPLGGVFLLINRGSVRMSCQKFTAATLQFFSPVLL